MGNLINCPTCKTPVALEDHSVEKICPACGARWVASGSSSNADSNQERTVQGRFISQIMFWFFFLGTPAAIFFAAGAANSRLNATTALIILLLGAWAAGYCLTYIRRRSFPPGLRTLVSLLYGAGVLVVYLGLLFVGCVIAFS